MNEWQILFSARSLCWGVADASAIGVAVAIKHRIRATVENAYEVFTRCVRDLYDLQLVYEIIKSIFDR